MSSALSWMVIGAAGGVGAVARFLVDAAVATRLGRAFPFGTLVVNLSGAFALGLAIGFALLGDALRLVGTGALGSYTTFSTWMFESQRLAEDGDGAAAALNIVLSVATGLLAVAAGRALGEWL